MTITFCKLPEISASSLKKQTEAMIYRSSKLGNALVEINWIETQIVSLEKKETFTEEQAEQVRKVAHGLYRIPSGIFWNLCDEFTQKKMTFAHFVAIAATIFEWNYNSTLVRKLPKVTREVFVPLHNYYDRWRELFMLDVIRS